MDRNICSPDVSIIMPVRNEARYLQQALDSIMRQTLQEWELIVIDDGSTDATPQILAEAAAHEPRIRIITQSGQGLVAALNAGISASNAPLIARMDGDDICHPRRLERQFACLAENPQIGLVACNFAHFPRRNLKQGMIEYETWQNTLVSHELIMQDLYVESPLVHPSVMFRKAVLDLTGNYRNLEWPEDYDLWLRMAACGVTLARLPETLFFWRDHPERATRCMNEYSFDAFRRCKLHHLSHGFLKDVDRVVIAGAGKEGKAWQRLLSELQIRVTVWIDVDPRKSGRILHGAPIFAPQEYEYCGTKLVIAIGVKGAREQYTNYLQQQGLKNGRDYIAVC